MSENTAIHYAVYGSGTPILLLHGGLSHQLSWFSQLPWLVASGRQVILVDSRGHGKSGLGDIELSYGLLALDAVQILDQLKIQSTDIIGWSDGANTALILARYWPKRVQRIVAISGNSDPSGLTPMARRQNLNASSGLNSGIYRWWIGAGKHLDELEKRLKKLWQNGPNLHPEDLLAIKAPTLVIIGENDLVTSDHAKQMAAQLPDGDLSIIPAGGHSTLFTHAHQVNILIAKFLKITLNQ